MKKIQRYVGFLSLGGEAVSFVSKQTSYTTLNKVVNVYNTFG
jgi:hypothetical protein